MNNTVKLFYTAAVAFLFFSCNYGSRERSGYSEHKTFSNPNGRNDRWGFIGPGGGGAMFNPAIDPADPGHIFVSCDMTGSYVTYDGGKHWRMFNLRDVTRFYVFDRNDSAVVYTGTLNMLFRSSDRGKSWSVLYPGPSDIVAILAQGDHADEVVINRDSIRTDIEKLAVDPANPQRLFLMVRKRKIDFWPPTRRNNKRYYMAVLLSEDCGGTWKMIDKLPFDLNNIFIDPGSPEGNRTYYVTGEDGIGVKEKGMWRDLPLPYGAGPPTMFADGFDSTTNKLVIYAVFGKSYFNSNGKGNDSRIYRTENGGKTWHRIEGGLLAYSLKGAKAPEFRSIAISYYHPENIYVSYDRLWLDKDTISFGVAKSMDSGRTWKLVWSDKILRNVPGNHGIPSPNREQGWLDGRFGPTWGENPFQMKVADHNPDICYATDFGRTIKTTDGGHTWQQVYTDKVPGGGWKSRGLQVTTGYMLAFDPFDRLHVFMGDTDTGLMESFDGGKSWHSTTKNNGVPREWVNTTYWLVFDPDIKGKVWAVMSGTHDLPRPKMWRHKEMNTYRGGVLVSCNAGKTWQATSEDIGEAAITHIVLDPESNPDNRTLYVCAFGKGVYKSQDGGKTWQQKNKDIEGIQPAAWRMTRRADGELFLVVARKSDDGSIGNDGDGALYRSSDGAESWIKMRMPEGVNGPVSLLVDPDHPDRLLLSAWGRYGPDQYSPNRGGGIYLSEDDGASWKPVLTRDQHIHDLTVDVRNGVFYACGYNSSAYRSDDRGNTWRRIKGYNFKWGKRVQPDPFNPAKIYIITFGGGVWYGPARGDENALEDIITPQAAVSGL